VVSWSLSWCLKLRHLVGYWEKLWILTSEFGKRVFLVFQGLYFWASSIVHWRELEFLLFTLRLDVLAAEAFALSGDYK
jgi:hypothetical protein